MGFGKVFGRVSTAGQGQNVRNKLEETGVEGLIDGLKSFEYDDTKNARAAAKVCSAELKLIAANPPLQVTRIYALANITFHQISEFKQN